MSKIDRQKVYQEIMTILKVNPDGAAIEMIIEGLSIQIPRRTLQHRLKELVTEKKIISTGAKRGTVYHLPAQQQELTKKSPETQQSFQLSSFSALKMQELNQKNRPPVTYQEGFLDNYIQNETFYLSLNEREHLAAMGTVTPFQMAAGTYAKQILHRLLIDLAWNSSRLEGNTYSLLDTQKLFAEGAPATEKSAMETQMILNHKEAIEFIVQNADSGIGLNRYTILNLHALLSNNLLPDPAASGRLRTFGVGITGSVYQPPDIPQQIEFLFDRILQKAGSIQNPFEQAFFVMVHLPYLQPFDDVNKRVSRIAANIPLNRHNLSPLSFTDVPADLYISGLLAIYELNEVSILKEVFIHAYEKSAERYASLRQTIGEPDQFKFKYRDALRTVINVIIRDGMEREKANLWIKASTANMPAADQEIFIQTIEKELLSLHEGNFARYMVTPSEFQKWKNLWKL